MYDRRSLLLGEEVLTSVRLIERGLAEIQQISGASDFRHAALLLLSGGLERLMKCVLCYHARKTTGFYPALRTLKADSHNLETLLGKVRDRCFTTGYAVTRGVAREDATFVQDDAQFSRVIAALSRFAKSARYYNLDVVCGVETDTESPEREWSDLIGEVLLGRPELMAEFLDPLTNASAYDEVASQFTVMLERFVRAVSRLFAFGQLGKDALQISGYVSAFTMLDDAALGRTRYWSVSGGPLTSPR